MVQVVDNGRWDSPATKTIQGKDLGKSERIRRFIGQERGSSLKNTSGGEVVKMLERWKVTHSDFQVVKKQIEQKGSAVFAGMVGASAVPHAQPEGGEAAPATPSEVGSAGTDMLTTMNTVHQFIKSNGLTYSSVREALDNLEKVAPLATV